VGGSIEKPNDPVGSFDPPTFAKYLERKEQGSPPLGTNKFNHLPEKSESELDSFSAELDTFVRRLVPSGSSLVMSPCIRSDVSAVSE